MKFKQRLFVLIFACGMCLSSMVNSKADWLGYWDYLIYSDWGNNYTNVHAKQTSTQNIENFLSSIHNTNVAPAVRFWGIGVVADTAYRVTSYHIQSPGETITMQFNQGIYVPQGNNVQLGMENRDNVGFTTTYRGSVNFK